MRWFAALVLLLFFLGCAVVEPAEQVARTGPSCAGEGEQYSDVFTDEYPGDCCEGLTPWMSGMDTRVAIAGRCYPTEMLSGWPVGLCLACGDGECAEPEDSCNCPEDCAGKGGSDYASLDDFCASAMYERHAAVCDEYAPESPGAALCALCTDN